MDFIKGSMRAMEYKFPCWTDSMHLNWRIVKISAHPEILADDVRYNFLIMHFNTRYRNWGPIDAELANRYLNGLHVHKFLGSFTLAEAKYLLAAIEIAMGE